MKNKIIAIFNSLVLSIMLFSPLNVHATSVYNNPNGLGGIDSSDGVLIHQYLNTSTDVSNLERLDFDNNSIVSMADEYKVQLYNLGLLNTGTINLPAAATYNGSTSETYRVFNAQTGALDILKTYTLFNFSPVINNINEPDSPDSIIGNDERVPNWDRSGVVKIMSDNYYLGTGFVVGPHIIATAAHCVYNYSNANIESCNAISKIKLFDSNGTCQLNATPVECHVPYSYIYSVQNNIGQATNEFDYALISVSQNLSEYLCFDLGVALNAASVNQFPVTVTGFPEKVYEGTQLEQTVNTGTEHNMYHDTGNLTYSTSFCPNRQLFYTADMSSGNSGGPVYVTEHTYDIYGNNHRVNYSVVAINVSGCDDFNIGTRINGELIRFYKGNQNISWQLPT